uniref:Uncharacterized protein n=1 Tax=Tanacetum cinerariifolium TaxID=118510 RepID=A0A6L2MXW8_TANCI|nr:hypothetical protein [Tanacetum cinerariifolium]
MILARQRSHLGGPASDAALWEYCDRNYHKLLPIIAEKVHQENVQQEKFKAVKARLNFEEASQHSESGTPSRMKDLKKRLRSRRVCSMSGSPEPRRDHFESSRKKGRLLEQAEAETKAILALEIWALYKGKFKPPPPMTTPVEKRNASKFCEFPGEVGHTIDEYHAKAGKKGETSGKDKPLAILMVQPWQRVAKQRITHIFYPESVICFPPLEEEDGTESLREYCDRNYHQLLPITAEKVHQENVQQQKLKAVKVRLNFEEASQHSEASSQRTESLSENEGSAGGHWKAKPKRQKSSIEVDLSQPWISRPLIINGRSHFRCGNNKKLHISKTSKREDSRTSRGRNKSRTGEKDETKGPMIFEAKMGVHFVHRMYLDGGSFSKIVYEHCFNRFRPERNHRKARNKENTDSSVYSSRNTKISSDRRYGWSTRIIPLECIMVSGPGVSQLVINQFTEEKIQVAIHPEYSEQTIAIGSTLTEEGRKELCGLLRRNLDIFAWKPADMTGVPRHIAEHSLNICEGIHHKPRNILLLKNVARIKNAQETYQRLVDKAFQKQIGLNFKVYVDDLVIKSHTKKEVIRYIKETFKTLREINMKLNPKKCTFWMREDMFLGYKLNADELKVCPDKVEAVICLPSPKCLKDVQRLNVKLASLNRFLSKSAKKIIAILQNSKKCTKKSDFQWIAEAKIAFKQMKTFMLTASKEKEELVIYLVPTKEATRLVLMMEMDGKQMPIYFVSHALQGLKINYTPMEKLMFALRFELEEHDIHYRPRTSVKGQILADFIVEHPKDDRPDTPMEDNEELSDPWIVFTNGSSCIDGSGAGLIITNPEGVEFTYALRFRFDATNNEAKYKALIAGLWIAEQMGAKNLQVNINSRILANQVNVTCIEKESGMIKYLEKVKALTSTFKKFSIKKVPRGANKNADVLSKMASTSFAHLIKQVLVEELKEKSIDEKEVLAVVEEWSTWMTPIHEYLMEDILLEEKRKARAIRCKARRYRAGSNLGSKCKAKMEKYYNARVRNTSFKPGDLIYWNNEASHIKDGGKLGPKWEGPYEVTKALGKGAYKLRDRNENILP